MQAWAAGLGVRRFYEQNKCMRLEMSFDYEKYEMDCKKIRKENELLLDDFESWLLKKDLDELKERIKDEMPEWIATMKRYDDPSITDMEEVWGL